MNVKGTKKKNQVVNVMEQQELLKKADSCHQDYFS